ncbi:MAG: FHA domain-containing protein [Planctomycetes bacterium]|nr:FHA domain-containing protein [Planctomycetota bacterium]
MFGLFRRRRADPRPPSSLRGEIWVVQGERLGEKWGLEDGEVVIGRGLDRPRAINFSETAKFVSSEHARFWKDERGYWVEDIGSKNGTFLNRHLLKEKTLLVEGDEVEIGNVMFRVYIVPKEQTASEERFSGEIEVVRGARKGEKFSLDQGDLLVGRELEGNGVISLPDDETLVSTEHAVFRKVRGTYTIRDLGSTNGTGVNGEKKVSARLSDGDEVTIGNVIFRVRLTQSAPR